MLIASRPPTNDHIAVEGEFRRACWPTLTILQAAVFSDKMLFLEQFRKDDSCYIQNNFCIHPNHPPP